MQTPLFYEIYGAGKPVFLLHGLALDHSIWYPVAEILSSSMKVILPDLRGHGNSRTFEGECSIDAMAKDILDVMDILHVETAHIAGHSMGGYIALAFARCFPDRLSGLALVASHIYPDSEEKTEARLKQIQELNYTEPAIVFRDMPGNLTRDKTVANHCVQLIKNTDPDCLKCVLAGMIQRQSSENIWKRFHKPAVIIAGAEDQFIPIDSSRKMAEMMLTPWLIEVRGAGHMVMMEDPVQTGDVLTKWSQKD